MKTKVDLILDLGEGSDSEVFENFKGSIPSVGDEVTYYKKYHDGCRWHGFVTKVEHRIENHYNDGGAPIYLQTIRVSLKWDDGAGTL